MSGDAAKMTSSVIGLTTRGYFLLFFLDFNQYRNDVKVDYYLCKSAIQVSAEDNFFFT